MYFQAVRSSSRGAAGGRTAAGAVIPLSAAARRSSTGRSDPRTCANRVKFVTIFSRGVDQRHKSSFFEGGGGRRQHLRMPHHVSNWRRRGLEGIHARGGRIGRLRRRCKLAVLPGGRDQVQEEWHEGPTAALLEQDLHGVGGVEDPGLAIRHDLRPSSCANTRTAACKHR